ncbi:MAG TPA: sensor domain-containing diguanylate cyclase [Candidatus Xenobia bacterium]|jgi:diguanylate cyclase (GGDEF)-like protein
MPETHDMRGLLDLATVQGLLNTYAELVPSHWELRQDDGAVLCHAGASNAVSRGDGPVAVKLELPVKLRDRVLGTLAVAPAGDERLNTLSQGMVRLIEGWVADRFEVRSLVSELVLRYEELSVLYDASETIVSNMDLEEVSRLILTKAHEILDVKTASLMLLDPETNTLRVKDALGLNPELIHEIKLNIGEEISGWVAREGKPLLIEDIEKHPEFRKVNQENYATRSLLSVPLKIKDRVIGVLNVNNKLSGEVFNSGDLKILAALASLAAISIENATTYKNAITDRLTRLYNYGYFREQLYKKVAQSLADNEPMTLLMFDIDHFKYFNDRNGHELGNVCLVGVAGICMENCRQKGDRLPDLVARYGGEEFLILLSGVPKAPAAGTAERIRSAIETTQFEGGQNQPMGKVTISVGVAEVPGDAQNGDDLINAADQALYRAKRAGRNQVQLA